MPRRLILPLAIVLTMAHFARVAAVTLVFTAAAAMNAAHPASGPFPAEVWSGARAMADIATQLQFTPRSLDTPGHEKTIDFIKAELAKTSVKSIKTQRWIYRGNDRAEHALTNIIASFDPSNPRRMIVATHYDSIVRAYRDASNPSAPMPGANNSASGVALLLETARVLSSLPPPPVGIDLIFFDGEEGPLSLGAGDPNWRALGSPHFAEHLSDFYPNRKPEKGVVFDMICYKDLKVKPELSSLVFAKAEVEKFWKIGATIAPSVFLREATTFPISDDHSALAEAGIPSFLIIDFEYEPWFNTTEDTTDKCSAASLEAVGRTLLRYLYIP
jgi:glutaminyl-peptide cyclotransferase